jgi:hypothetical protein
MGFVNKRSISSITIGGQTIYGGDVEMTVPGGSVDPETGEIVIPTGGSGTVESFTLNAGDISNKYILVSSNITTDSSTIFKVSGLPSTLKYGVEFTVDDTDKTKVKWDGLSLDGVLVVGDEVEITYF